MLTLDAVLIILSGVLARGQFGGRSADLKGCVSEQALQQSRPL
jgi:hypothetical protein